MTHLLRIIEADMILGILLRALPLSEHLHIQIDQTSCFKHAEIQARILHVARLY